jgi:sec-independent protein translocase protein TatA
MGNMGFWEILVIMLVVLLLFGAKRLPEMGSSIGKGLREFKRSLTETQDAINNAGKDDQQVSGGRQFDAPQTPPTSGEPKRLSQ